MSKTTDQAVLNDWYAIATASEVTSKPVTTRLLGQDIEYFAGEGGALDAADVREREAAIEAVVGRRGGDGGQTQNGGSQGRADGRDVVHGVVNPRMMGAEFRTGSCWRSATSTGTWRRRPTSS